MAGELFSGLGQGLVGLGNTWAQNRLAQQDRETRDQQRLLENYFKQQQLDHYSRQQAELEAQNRRENIMGMLKTLPGDSAQLSTEQGQSILRDLPQAEGLLINKDKTLASRPFNMTAGGGVQPGAEKPAWEGYTAQRPVTDSYLRNQQTYETNLAGLDIRRENARNRLMLGSAATRARMQIAQMTDVRQRQIAQQALGALMKRHADVMANRRDATDLDWAQADAELEMDWQQLAANSLFPVDPTNRPQPPSRKRGVTPGKTTSMPSSTDSIIDDVLKGM